MKKVRNLKRLSLGFFILGIFFLLNSELNITGAIILSSNISYSFNIIFGIAFVLISFLIFAYSNRLERSLGDTSEIELEYENPVIIDTNYLIEACKTHSEYKRLMDFIRDRHEHGQPVIVPKSVFNEFKSLSHDPGEESRIKNLKESLSKYSTTIENIRNAEWHDLAIKKKSNEIAENILHQTPKYFAYKYLSEVDGGEHITVDRFLGKSLGKMSNAFPESKYEENIQSARREYDKINDKKGFKSKKNFLSAYDISPADVEVLSTALLLGEQPLDKVDIITKDSHLIDSSKVFNKIFPEQKDKINIRDKI